MTTMTMATVETPTPPLKWAGGKRWLVPHLLGYWRRHADARLVEPFCGGLSVALGLQPKRALLNDINPHLMNFYRQIQQSGRPFPEFVTFSNEAECYYASRQWFNELIREPGGRDTDTASALFYYLNRTGYNGLCRFNASGGYNVPFGRYATINYRRDFHAHHEAFARWVFDNVSFERVALEPGDFVYADPPYDVPFTHYSSGGFGWDDQVKTAEWLARHDGPVLLSNQATPRIEELYRDLRYEVEFLNAPRRISCTGDRAPAPEILARLNCPALSLGEFESGLRVDPVDGRG